MKRVITLFTVFLFASVFTNFLFAQQEGKKTSVAVLDFEGKGITEMEASILTDRFRSELVQTRAFTVTERAQIQEILKEQGFQQSGACNTSECIAEVGKILGLEKMIGGSVGFFGGIYTVDIRVIDVATAQITETITRDVEGEMKVLLGVFRDIARQFASTEGTIKPDLQKIADLPKPAKKKELVLKIDSKPSGAAVTIDGVLQNNVTPITVTLPEGLHSIEVNRNYYETWQRTITLDKDQILNAELELNAEGQRLMAERERKKKDAEQKPEEVKEKGGGKGWLWAILGIVGIGGGAAAAVVLGQGSKDSPPIIEEPPGGENDLPNPPDPPN